MPAGSFKVLPLGLHTTKTSPASEREREDVDRELDRRQARKGCGGGGDGEGTICSLWPDLPPVSGIKFQVGSDIATTFNFTSTQHYYHCHYSAAKFTCPLLYA